jgi:hypothetical protein
MSATGIALLIVVALALAAFAFHLALLLRVLWWNRGPISGCRNVRPGTACEHVGWIIPAGGRQCPDCGAWISRSTLSAGGVHEAD